MSFQVVLSGGRLKVVDANGQPVPGGRVHRVTFPERSYDTSEGRVWEVDGPATADISVPSKGGRDFHAGVPVT